MALTFYLLLNEFRMVQPMLKKERKKEKSVFKSSSIPGFCHHKKLITVKFNSNIAMSIC